MTADHEACKPRTSARPGELGVHSVDHFNFAVPDLAQAAERFYTVRSASPCGRRARRLGIYTAMATTHRWGRGHGGCRPSGSPTSRSACFPEDLEGLAGPPAAGANDVPAAGPARGLREQRRLVPRSRRHADRDARGREVLARTRRRCKVQPVLAARRAGLARTLPGPPRASAAARAYPGLHLRRPESSIAFYGRVLGLRLSDRSGDGVAFMHGIHGSDHHMVAHSRSPNGPGLHHLSWDVGSIHEVGLGAMQMADKGVQPPAGAWGGTCWGQTTSTTCATPGAATAEYSSDIDYIPVDHDWPAADHPGARCLLRVGPQRRPPTSSPTTRLAG